MPRSILLVFGSSIPRPDVAVNSGVRMNELVICLPLPISPDERWIDETGFSDVNCFGDACCSSLAYLGIRSCCVVTGPRLWCFQKTEGHCHHTLSSSSSYVLWRYRSVGARDERGLIYYCIRGCEQ
jgi:hypothetical protein